jgi:phage shock protein PspC (stress-responsive transcriptional regulator)
MVGGVAGGMAQYMNLDPAWVRIAWLALLVLGPGVLLYIIAWIAIPEATAETDVEPGRVQHDGDAGKFIVGGLLILIGGSLLANQYVPWMKDLIVPASLIAVGTGVIIYSVKK